MQPRVEGPEEQAGSGMDSTSPRLAPAGETRVQLYRHEPSAGAEVFTERCAPRRMSSISMSLVFTELVMFEVGLEMTLSFPAPEGGTASPGRGSCRCKDTDLGKERIWVPNRTVTGQGVRVVVQVSGVSE